MEKLISMTDFVLKINKEAGYDKTVNDFLIVVNYAQFLKQPLTLGMFVPTDEEGNVLEPVIKMDYETKYPSECYEYDLDKYQKAKEKVLFKGFEIHILLDDVTKRLTSPNGCFNVAWCNNEKGWYLSNGVNKMTVQDLIQYEIELTETAIKNL